MIYHGGTFLGGRGQLYVGGSADVVGNMDPDFISLEEIRSAVNGLGYAESGDLWYTFDDEEWVAVKTFKSDRDVINMINRSRAEKRKVLNIFVEHVIDEAELLQLDSPLAELEARPSTYGGCGDDEDNNEGDREEEGSDYGTDLSEFSGKDVKEIGRAHV